MKMMVKIRIPSDRGNELTARPDFGQKMQELLRDIKAEAAYFTLINGQRGGYILLNMEENAVMPVVGEPLFSWLHADVEVFPVMMPEDLAKAQPAIQAAAQKWR
jgi:hypothetical protein